MKFFNEGVYLLLTKPFFRARVGGAEGSKLSSFGMNRLKTKLNSTFTFTLFLLKKR